MYSQDELKQFKNKILNMDCYDFLKELPDKSIDLVLTDPPYQFIDQNLKGGGFMKKENKSHLEEVKNIFGLNFNPKVLLNQCKRVLKTFNLYIFTNKNLLADYLNFAIENNFSYDILIWQKPNPIPCFNNHYLSDKEYCIFIREKGAYFNSNLKYEKYFTIFDYPVGKKETKHPNEKPINLIKKILEISTKENDLILDCFSGSGTTAIACQDMKRRFICIEKDKNYFEKSNKRLEDFKKQLVFEF